MDAVTSIEWTPVRVLTLLLILLTSIPLVTWLLSLPQSWPAKPGCGKEPPVAPYAIPYLQHMVSFLRNPGETFQRHRARYPKTPFSLLMSGTKFHIYQDAVTVSYIFGRSRAFAFEPVIASMMENGVNLPIEDRSNFYLQPRLVDGAMKAQSASSSFVHANHNIWLKYLAGKHLESIMEVYMEHFEDVRKSNPALGSREWKTVPIHETLQKIIFEASALTFFGTRLRKLWPNMWEDFKLFNDATYAGVRSNLSFYLQPKALRARERMLRAFDKWVDVAINEWPGEDGIWTEEWGIKMNWEREKLARHHNFSLRGRSCLQASFLFVIVTNAAPMATWFAYCAAKNKDCLVRFRQEISPARRPPRIDSGSTRFDPKALKRNHFILGLWKEALRLGSASAAARVVMEDAELEGYVVKKGSVLLMPVQLMHFDPKVFCEPHEVRPERWLVLDSDNEQEMEQLKRQNNALRSFGGGTGLCSGRFVAEEEILGVISTFLWDYDVEFDEAITSYEFNPRSIGVMSPAKDPIVQLRRRQSEHCARTEDLRD